MQWILSNPALTLSAALAALTAVRVGAMTGFDGPATVGIIYGGGTTNLLLATVVTGLPLLLFALFCLVSHEKVAQRLDVQAVRWLQVLTFIGFTGTAPLALVGVLCALLLVRYALIRAVRSRFRGASVVALLLLRPRTTALGGLAFARYWLLMRQGQRKVRQAGSIAAGLAAVRADVERLKKSPDDVIGEAQELSRRLERLAAEEEALDRRVGRAQRSRDRWEPRLAVLAERLRRKHPLLPPVLVRGTTVIYLLLTMLTSAPTFPAERLTTAGHERAVYIVSETPARITGMDVHTRQMVGLRTADVTAREVCRPGPAGAFGPPLIGLFARGWDRPDYPAC